MEKVFKMWNKGEHELGVILYTTTSGIKLAIKDKPSQVT